MKFNEPSYHFGNDNMFMRNNVRAVGYGSETISFLGPKIWSILPNEHKETDSILKFKKKI